MIQDQYAFAIKKRLEKKDENPSILLVDGGRAVKCTYSKD